MVQRNVDLIIRAKDDATKAFNAVNEALSELAGVQKTVTASSDKMGAALGRVDAGAKKAADSLGGDVTVAARRVKEAYDQIGRSLDKARVDFSKQEKLVREQGAALAALKAQAASAASAIDRMRGKIGPLRPEDIERLKAGERQMKALNREASQSAAAFARAQQALENSSHSLRGVESAANAAEVAIREMQTRAARNTAARESVSEQQRLAQSFREAAEAARNASRVGVAEQTQLANAYRRAQAAADRAHPSIGRLVRELIRVGPAARVAGDGLAHGARQASVMRRAMETFYGESRRSLSIMQRLRGEVLSLTASFVGFYGIFNTGRSFVDAFQTIEAAQNRLGAAFQQNASQVSAEIGFLQQEADRLGFSFGVLSDNFSKFVIGGQSAGIEFETLKTIFVQVSEAARVLKLSNDDINGVLTAMTQIAGKGTLQMEELRQQLGDRLPGAVGLVANALGYGEERMAEFFKAVENGQIGAEEALVALGQGLQDTYGAQLDEALSSVTAKLGKFQNLLFNRQLTAANSGFIQGLEAAIDAINAFLSSQEGIEFFEGLGAAMGKVLEIIPAILENIDTLVLLLKTFASIKVAQFFQAIAAGIKTMGVASFATRRQAVLMNRALIASSPALAGLLASAGRGAVALRVLRGAMLGVATAGRAIMALVGGPIGAAIAVVSFFALDLLPTMDRTVETLNDTLSEHEATLSQVREAYANAAGDATKFREELEKVNAIQVEDRLRVLKETLAELREDDPRNGFFRSKASHFDRPVAAAVNETAQRTGNEDVREAYLNYSRLDAALKSGKASASEVREALVALRQALGLTSNEVLSLIATEDRRLGQMVQTEEAIDREAALLAVLNGTATEAQKALLGLAEATSESVDAMKDAARKVSEFEEAMRSLGERIPEVNAVLKQMDGLAAIETSFQNALAAARALPDAIMRAAATAEAQKARLDALSEFGSSSVDGSIVDKIIGVESGGNASAQNPNSTARGLGQFIESTWLRLFKEHFPERAEGMTRGQILALRDDPELSRRMIELAVDGYARSLSQNGMPVTDPNLYLSHFLGSGGAQKLLSAAPGTAVSSILPQGVIDANQSVLGGGKTREDVIAWAREKMGITEQELAVTQRLGAIDAERAKTAQEFTDSLRARLDDENFANSIGEQDLVNREVALALREAEQEAAKAGVVLTQAQLDEIEAITREKFKQQGLDEARNKALAEARKMEEEIGRLQDRKQFLTEQRDFQLAQGDFAGVQQTQSELETVNEALDASIEKALEFWAAMGGEGSEAALQALQQSREELHRVKQTVVVTADQINNSFADKATNAFMSFAQAVAAGEKPIEALGRAFAQMASEILLELAQMIIRQAIFNAISGMFGGGSGGLGGVVSGGINALFRHGGGLVNGSGRSGNFSPAVFANARRYHTGGIAGLMPDEVPTILKKNEEVLTEGDPRHRFNGGMGGGSPKIKVVNAVDGSDALEQALVSGRGEELILNFMRDRRSQVRAALEG